MTPVDHDLLSRHQRFSDPQGAWSEEFLRPALGGAKTVAVLTRPLGSAHATGWVVCHSFGLEQVNLSRCEVLTARALAGVGFPVLRFHVQGYGDSERRWDPPSLAAHVEGAVDAVALLSSEGINRVGTFGIRLGGTVATLVADCLELSSLGTWESFIDGAGYMRDFRRLHTLSAITGGPESELPKPSPRGWSDVAGFVLTDKAREEIEQIDLIEDIRRFRGEALVAGVSRSGNTGTRLRLLAQRLEALGASCTTETIQDPGGPLLGQFHFRTRPDNPHVEVDSQLQLFRRIAETTARWAQSRCRDPGTQEAQ